MIEKIKIGDIFIKFIYSFNDYFKDELTKYRIDKLNDNYYTLEVKVFETIKRPNGDNLFHHKNTDKIRIDDKTYLITYNANSEIKHLITYDKDYKHITIKLNKRLASKLPEYEYVLSGMMFFEIAISNKYLPIHASAIRFFDKAILLSGPSKSGKSTQTKYFLEVANQSIIINEDKPLIYQKNNDLYVCGSPWSGKNVLNQNLEVKLNHIFFINKANITKITDLTYYDKMKEIMRNIHRPSNQTNIDHMVSLIERIIKKVNIQRFDCINNKSSIEYLLEYLEANK